MSSIVKTDAVVLRSMKYLETSRIVTLYTRRRGKMSCLVKGARRAGRNLGPALDPASYVSVVFYHRESRELQTVTQCDLIKQFKRLSEDLGAMAAAMAIVELVGAAVHDEEENDQLFRLIVDCLETLNEPKAEPPAVLHYFQIHLARIMGFQPSFDRCAVCSRPFIIDPKSPALRFHLGKGAPVCANCSRTQSEEIVGLRLSVFQILVRLAASGRAGDVLAVKINHDADEELSGFIRSYLRRHIAGLRALRSEGVFSHIFSSS